ncbi:MAG: hypothetical protein JWQ04_423 [Pedosphaera sp.]|nr:hypothetical protein [Pedosphaera sp.]
MTSSPSVYVDFNRFIRADQNRDLLNSGVWQRNIQFLTASLERNSSHIAFTPKPMRRR